MNKPAHSKKRIACLHLPNWPIQRLMVARPEWRGSALVLHAPSGRRGECVSACSDAATRQGVRLGMPMAEATALCTDCRARFLAHETVADREALEKLAEWSEQFSPLVGLEEAAQPDSLLLDVTGLGPLCQGEASLGRTMIEKCHDRGLEVCIGIAQTVGAAWAAAHFATEQRLAIITSDEMLGAIHSMSVAALRLPEETVHLLGELGVQRIDQLLALPRDGLTARFGTQLITRIDQATGAAKEVIRAHRPPTQFAATWSLEHATARSDQIEWVLRHLTERLADDLAGQGVGATQLEVRFDFFGNPPPVPHLLCVGLYRASATADHLWQLVRLQMERLALRWPVIDFSIHATSTAPLECRQQQLFGEAGAAPQQHELASLVDRLSSRLGRSRVCRPRRTADAQPEHAWRAVPLADITRRSRSSQSAVRQTVFARPLRLEKRPVALGEISVSAEGTPERFVCEHETHRVVRCWGPERIETGWWRKRRVRRDYYRVETAAASQWWLFRHVGAGGWFLHGRFE